MGDEGRFLRPETLLVPEKMAKDGMPKGAGNKK